MAGRARAIPFRRPAPSARRHAACRNEPRSRRNDHRLRRPARPIGPRRSCFLKIRDRESYEFALASAAVALDMPRGGPIRQARIALGGVATVPGGLGEAEAMLAGQALDPASSRSGRATRPSARAARASTTPSRSRSGKRTLVRALLQAAQHGGLTWRLRRKPRIGSRRHPARRRARQSHRRCALSLRRSRRRPRLRASGDQRGGAAGPSARSISTRRKAVPGVLDILTYENAQRRQAAEHLFARAVRREARSFPERPKIWHDGQIVAVVVAETFEAAAEAAAKVGVAYDAEQPLGHARFRRRDGQGGRRHGSRRTRTRRSATPSRLLARRPSRSTPNISPRPSTTIRWSCSPRPALGRRQADHSGAEPVRLRAARTGSPSNSASTRTTSASSARIVGGAFGSQGLADRSARRSSPRGAPRCAGR